MKDFIPNWLIILGGIGQIFTALIYPYIRHRVFDWYMYAPTENCTQFRLKTVHLN